MIERVRRKTRSDHWWEASYKKLLCPLTEQNTSVRTRSLLLICLVFDVEQENEVNCEE